MKKPIKVTKPAYNKIVIKGWDLEKLSDSLQVTCPICKGTGQFKSITDEGKTVNVNCPNIECENGTITKRIVKKI